MRLISSEDLYKRLTELKERYKNSDDIVDNAIVVGLDRAITEVLLSQTQAYKIGGQTNGTYQSISCRT